MGSRRAAEGAYAWQSLLKAGAVIANGTDTPVESVDPLPCFYASVTRKLADVVVLSHDIMTVPDDEILQAHVLYTIAGGKVVFER